MGLWVGLNVWWVIGCVDVWVLATGKENERKVDSAHRVFYLFCSSLGLFVCVGASVWDGGYVLLNVCVRVCVRVCMGLFVCVRALMRISLCVCV